MGEGGREDALQHYRLIGSFLRPVTLYIPSIQVSRCASFSLSLDLSNKTCKKLERTRSYTCVSALILSLYTCKISLVTSKSWKFSKKNRKRRGLCISLRKQAL